MEADSRSSPPKELQKTAFIYKEEFATENYFNKFLVLQLEIY